MAPTEVLDYAQWHHGGGTEYLDGVNVLSSNSVSITITTTPQLYYYCQNHSGMGSSVNISEPSC